MRHIKTYLYRMLTVAMLLSVMASPAYAGAIVIDDSSLDLIARSKGSYGWLFDFAMVYKGTGDTVYNFTGNNITNATLIGHAPYSFIPIDVTCDNLMLLFKFYDNTGAYNVSEANNVYVKCGSGDGYVINISRGVSYADTGNYYLAYELPATPVSGVCSTFCFFVPENDVTLEVIYTAQHIIYDTSEFDYEENVIVCQEKTINKWLVILQKVSQYIINMVSLVYYITITFLLILIKYVLFPMFLFLILAGIRYMTRKFRDSRKL